MAGPVLLDIEGEVQLTDHTCWAAVSVMANRAFAGSIPQFSQLEIAALARSQVRNSKEFSDAAKQARYLARRSSYQRNGILIGNFEPWLFDLAAASVHEGKVLRLEHFLEDLAVRNLPIIIQWDYSADHRVQSDDPRGRHVLMVTGYNPGTSAEAVEKRLRVWDPWPTAARVLTRGNSAQHEKWISYKHYVSPVNDHGIAAAHGFDLYSLHVAGTHASHHGYPATLAPASSIPVIEPVVIDFASALGSAQRVVESRLQSRIVLTREGTPVPGPFAADVLPFPVVALRASDIDRNRDRLPELLGDRTSTLLVPVLVGERVVDSFLLLYENSLWREAGYSNDRIAQNLVSLRQRFASGVRLAKDFYLVSIPELGTFFIAHGHGQSAVLASLADDGVADLIEGDAALRQVVARMDARDAGDPETWPPATV